MTTLEITLILVGIVFLIGSFMVKDKLSKIQQQNVVLILNTDKILDNQKEILSILKKTTD